MKQFYFLDMIENQGKNLRLGTSIFGLFLCFWMARSNAFSSSFAFSTDSSAVLKLTAPPALQRVSVAIRLSRVGEGKTKTVAQS